jgi:putative tryptophan/tyrosine transport system substrate-binding protein
MTHRPMRRREFITLLGGGAAAWPLAAGAQERAVPVVGYLSVGVPLATTLDGLRRGLNEQGYSEGRNVTFDFRDTEQYDRLPALAAELVRRPVAVIVTASNINAAQAAKAATATIPIVFAVGADPVMSGLVPSLNRPAGNITGVTYLGSEMEPKLLELLRELVPQAMRIALLVNPTNSQNERNVGQMQSAARSVGQEIIVLRASTAGEIDAAFASLVEQRAGGLLVYGDGLFGSRRDQLVALAAIHKIPSVYFTDAFPKAGGLMSYSDDRLESWRQVGLYVGRILKGEKPANLPVLQPVKFDFVINLKTAKALGIEFPPSFHLRATEVIE